MWGRTAGYIDQYAPPDKRNPDVFQVWPKTIGPMGKAPLTQFDNEPWVIYADAPAHENDAAKNCRNSFAAAFSSAGGSVEITQRSLSTQASAALPLGTMLFGPPGDTPRLRLTRR